MPLLGGTTGLFRAAGGLLAGCVEGCCAPSNLLRCYQEYERFFTCSTNVLSPAVAVGARFCALPSTVVTTWRQVSSNNTSCTYRIFVGGGFACTLAGDCVSAVVNPPTTLPDRSGCCQPNICCTNAPMINSMILTLTGIQACACATANADLISGSPPNGTHTLPRNSFQPNNCAFLKLAPPMTFRNCFGNFNIAILTPELNCNMNFVRLSFNGQNAGGHLFNLEEINRLCDGGTVSGQLIGDFLVPCATNSGSFMAGPVSFSLVRGS